MNGIFARCANGFLIFALISFLVAPFFVSCGSLTSGSVDGRILDARGRGLPDARVFIAGKEFRTDAGGYFHAKSVPTGRLLVRVTRAKYAESFKRILVPENLQVAFDLRMLPGQSRVIKDFSKANRIVAPRLELRVPANSLVDETGKPAGAGKLDFSVLDPRGEGSRAMPGSFRGVMANGKKVHLESMGAASIVFRSAAGKKLQVKQGKNLEMYMPVMGRVPRGAKSIPMWYLDEKSGLWKNQGRGKIVRRGGRLMVRARLPHLSWWNVDAPYHDKSSIWIKSIVGSDGYFMKNPAILARGLTYNGISAARPVTDGMGFCVDAKLSSRVILEALYRDEASYYHRRREIRLKDSPSSCDRNPADGVIIEKLVMEASKFTCARGSVVVNRGDVGSFANDDLRVQFITEGRNPVILHSQPADPDGDIRMDRLPGNVKGKVRLYLKARTRMVDDQLMMMKSSSSALHTKTDGGDSCHDFEDIKLELKPFDCAAHAKSRRHGENFSDSYDLFIMKDGRRIQGCGAWFAAGKDVLHICKRGGGVVEVKKSDIRETRMYRRSKRR